MPRFAPVLVCSLVLTAGCAMNRPPIQAPDAAWNTYHGRLAEQCSAKHLDNLSPVKFNEIAHDYYVDADTQIQQLIDLDSRNSCKANNDFPNCYNTGFVQASVQAGSTTDFVKKVCSKS